MFEYPWEKSVLGNSSEIRGKDFVFQINHITIP